MSPHEQQQLRERLDGFDEAALIALGNRGLLRRATKDLTSLTFSVTVTEHCLHVSVGDWTVRMPPSGPAQATDDTPATGITRQIIAATLYLREHWHPATTVSASNTSATHSQVASDAESLSQDKSDASVLKRLLSISEPQLRRWAGVQAFRKGRALARNGNTLDVVLDNSGLPTLRLIKPSVEVRLLDLKAGRSNFLDALHSTAPRTEHAMWVVAAILLLQQQRERSVPRVERPASPRDQELNSRVRLVLSRLVTLGLRRSARTCGTEMAALAVQARGSRATALARSIEVVGRELHRLESAHPSASVRRTLTLLADTYARCEIRQGFEHPNDEAEDQASLTDAELIAVGLSAASIRRQPCARVIFWDRSAERFLTWTTDPLTSSDSRDRLDALVSGNVLRSGLTPEEAIGRRFKVRQAILRDGGRFSHSRSTRVSAVDANEPVPLSFGKRAFRSWSKLRECVNQSRRFPSNRLLRSEADYVVLEPSRWGPHGFDETSQRLFWSLRDEADQDVAVTLPWSPHHEPAIRRVETLRGDAAPADLLLCEVIQRAGEITLAPVSLIRTRDNEKASFLHLDFARGSAVRSQNVRSLSRSDIPADRAELWNLHVSAGWPNNTPPAFRQFVDELDQWLCDVAELGTNADGERFEPECDQLLSRARSSPLDRLSGMLHRVRDLSSPDRAEQLLRLKFVTGRLHAAAWSSAAAPKTPQATTTAGDTATNGNPDDSNS